MTVLPADHDPAFDVRRDRAALEQAATELQRHRETLDRLTAAASGIDRLAHLTAELDKHLARAEQTGPLLDSLVSAAPTLAALEAMGLTAETVETVTERLRTLGELILRIELVRPKLDRIDNLIAMLDQAEVLVRRQ